MEKKLFFFVRGNKFQNKLILFLKKSLNEEYLFSFILSNFSKFIFCKYFRSNFLSR